MVVSAQHHHGRLTIGEANTTNMRYSSRGRGKRNYEVATTISFEDAARGSEVALGPSMSEIGLDGTMQSGFKTVRLRVPKAVS